MNRVKQFCPLDGGELPLERSLVWKVTFATNIDQLDQYQTPFVILRNVLAQNVSFEEEKCEVLILREGKVRFLVFIIQVLF